MLFLLNDIINDTILHFALSATSFSTADFIFINLIINVTQCNMKMQKRIWVCILFSVYFFFECVPGKIMLYNYLYEEAAVLFFYCAGNSWAI